MKTLAYPISNLQMSLSRSELLHERASQIFQNHGKQPSRLLVSSDALKDLMPLFETFNNKVFWQNISVVVNNKVSYCTFEVEV